MGDMGFFDHIEDDKWRRVAGHKRGIEELEMTPLRQATGATLVFSIADERL
jgi:hypothetical protein